MLPQQPAIDRFPIQTCFKHCKGNAMNGVRKLLRVQLVSFALGCFVFAILFTIRPKQDTVFYLVLSLVLSGYVYIILSHAWTGLVRPDFKASILDEGHDYDSPSNTHTYTYLYCPHEDPRLKSFLEFYVSMRHLYRLGWIAIPLMTFMVFLIRS